MEINELNQKTNLTDEYNKTVLYSENETVDFPNISFSVLEAIKYKSEDTTNEASIQSNDVKIQLWIICHWNSNLFIDTETQNEFNRNNETPFVNLLVFDGKDYLKAISSQNNDK